MTPETINRATAVINAVGPYIWAGFVGFVIGMLHGASVTRKAMSERLHELMYGRANAR